MQCPITECGYRAQCPANIPKQIRIEIVEDHACEHGRKSGGQQPGQAEDRHVASAHFDGSKVRGESLAGGHDQHFADGDDHDGGGE